MTGTFLGTNTNKILVFVIDDSLGMGGGVWWGRVMVQNLPSERKLPMRKVQKKVKKTNKSAFSATHTYIKLTLVRFFFTFFHAPSPYNPQVHSIAIGDPYWCVQAYFYISDT